MSNTKKCIVIAWTEEVQVPDGKSFARDLGALPGMRSERVAHACVWLRKGTADDLVKASAHIGHDHPNSGRVYEFPTTEHDPLGRAKMAILNKVEDN